MIGWSAALQIISRRGPLLPRSQDTIAPFIPRATLELSLEAERQFSIVEIISKTVIKDLDLKRNLQLSTGGTEKSRSHEKASENTSVRLTIGPEGRAR